MIIQVKAISSDQLNWPSNCAICAKEIKPKHKDQACYCSKCQVKRNRLEKIQDSAFMISLPFGVLGFIGSLIGSIIEDGFHTSIIIVAVAGGLFSMGIVYVLVRILLMPFQLIFHSKFARPGLKFLKSKEPGTLRIRFKNLEYANKFKEINN